MPITETKAVSRSTDTIPYFNDTISMPSWIAELTAAGKLSKIITNSDDNLTQTRVITFADFDTYNRVETELLTVEWDYNFLTYIANTNGTVPRTYTQTGIEQPFTCTTVYTFPEAGLAMHEALISTINNDNRSLSKLLTLDHTDTIVTAVHKYDNSKDFTATCWTDVMHRTGVEKSLPAELHEAGVTRTIEYKFV